MNKNLSLYIFSVIISFFLSSICSAQNTTGKLDIEKLDKYIEKSRKEWQIRQGGEYQQRNGADVRTPYRQPL